MTEQEQFKRIMFGSIVNINHMHAQRRSCFNLIGQYDGAMSDGTKAAFREEYQFWDSLIKELEAMKEPPR